VYDAVDRQESELVFVQELFALLKRFLIDTSEDAIQLFELCDPEFSALRAHAQDAYASRESDINGFTSLLNEQIASVRDTPSYVTDLIPWTELTQHMLCPAMPNATATAQRQ
jgi:hypothetical protein